ncbi:MAG: AEC family transporter [Ruminococcaceae bacterium]|nr:AEC family transporter [Oscillospiraceae bacterium]
MESFVFALNAVLPIILMIVMGYILKKKGYMNLTFAKAANKLVFHFFLPTMLFLNVYNIDNVGGIDLGYVVYVTVALLIIFVLSIPVVRMLTKKSERRGALLQAGFRSNYALIGIPLAKSLFGDEGVAVATLLSIVVIPLLNALAVVSLSMFSDGGEKVSVKKILTGVVKNPLIQSVTLGLVVLGIRALFVNFGIEFRLSDITPLFKVLTYLSNLATPLALLVLGAQFEFSAVAELKREILFGTLMRTVIVPVLGIGTAYVFFGDIFGGAHFASFVAVFATPVSVSSVPMAQEMGADSTLAGQLVIWTTMCAALSVFITSFLLKAGGIF